MAKQNWKGSALIAPIPPALVSCGSMQNPNIITIAWTGILNTIPPKTYISIRPSRHSYNLIKESGEFVINLTTRSLVYAADFCGMRSGADHDKFALMGLDPERAPELDDCPMIAQSPVNLQCKVTSIIPLGSHDMFMADIIGVCVDEAYIDKKGKLNLDRCQLAAFAHGEYFAVGEKLGAFGDSVRKKQSKPGREPMLKPVKADAIGKISKDPQAPRQQDYRAQGSKTTPQPQKPQKHGTSPSPKAEGYKTAATASHSQKPYTRKPSKGKGAKPRG